jgi:hypothetical protein
MTDSKTHRKFEFRLAACQDDIDATQEQLVRTATRLRDAAERAVSVTSYDAAEADFTSLLWVEDMTAMTAELQRLKVQLANLKEKRELLRQFVGDEG